MLLLRHSRFLIYSLLIISGLLLSGKVEAATVIKTCGNITQAGPNFNCYFFGNSSQIGTSGGYFVYNGEYPDNSGGPINVTQTYQNTNTNFSINAFNGSTGITGNTIWHEFDNAPGGDTWIYQFELRNGSWIQPNNQNTRIDWINPPETIPSATTTSRTINFQFSYYLNSSTDNAQENKFIRLSLCPLSYPNDDCQLVTILASTTMDSLELVNKTATTTRDGFYLGVVAFWNGVEENEECPWWNPFCEEQTVIVGQSNDNKFNVATTTITADIPPGVQALFGQCEDVGFFETKICNTLVFLFYPSDSALRYFEIAKEQYKSKLPFSLLYKISGFANNATGSTTPAEGSDIVVNMNNTFINGDVTMFAWEDAKEFWDTTFDESVREILVGIVWIIFSLAFFYVILHVI